MSAPKQGSVLHSGRCPVCGDTVPNVTETPWRCRCYLTLIQRAVGPNLALPPTWCVASCEQGCGEAWAVDTTDFNPPLTVTQVEELLTPELLEHERRVHAA